MSCFDVTFLIVYIQRKIINLVLKIKLNKNFMLKNKIKKNNKKYLKIQMI
jgi:hypothetical protein